MTGVTNIVSQLAPHLDVVEKQPPNYEYDQHLGRWRANVHRRLGKIVEKESEVIARLQKRLQNPWLNAYFTYTSMLGTDHFFILSLPMFFFFGHDELGRGLLIILALGGYMSTCLKDLFCSPRPFSPPVNRLTVLNHHLEYGFPSTHTTHSFSIALYLCLNTSSPYYRTLIVYALTIIFGRIYLGMHTFTDCLVGLVLGGLAVLIHSLPLTHVVEQWIFHSGIAVPAAVLSVFLVLLEIVPMPMDECPCYDDAVLSGAVAVGALLGRWGYGAPNFEPSADMMPGSGWTFEAGKWTPAPSNYLVWWEATVLKMIVGICIVFLWRLLVKRVFRELWRWIPVSPRMSIGVGNRPMYRYRTETLTKVVVYTGIAVLSCDVIPHLFVVLGLGVKSWP